MVSTCEILNLSLMVSPLMITITTCDIFQYFLPAIVYYLIGYNVSLFGALKLALATRQLLLSLSIAILTYAMLTLVLHMLTLALQINRAIISVELE